MAAHHLEVSVINANRPVEHVQRQIQIALRYQYDLAAAMKDAVCMVEHYLAQGTKSWDLREISMDLSYQVGTLVKLIMQESGHVYCDGIPSEDIRALMALDIADILSLALIMAYRLGIDPDEAFIEHLKFTLTKINERCSGVKA